MSTHYFRLNKNSSRFSVNSNTFANLKLSYNYNLFISKTNWFNIYTYNPSKFIWRLPKINQNSFIFTESILDLNVKTRINSLNIRSKRKLKKNLKFLKFKWDFKVYSFKNYFSKLIINKVKFSSINNVLIKKTKEIRKIDSNYRYT